MATLNGVAEDMEGASKDQPTRKQKAQVTVATLKGMEEDRQWAKQSIAADNAKKAKRKKSLPDWRLGLRRDEPDWLLDKTNFEHQQGRLASALKQWLGRAKATRYLNVRNFSEKMAIATSSDWDKALDFAYCRPVCNRRRGWFPCDETSYCPTCNWRLIGEPVHQEYKESFSKAPHWYALTLTFKTDPNDSWLRLVTRKDAKGVEKESKSVRVFDGAPVVRPIVQDDVDQLRACGNTPFRVIENLNRSRWIMGALASLYLYIAFWPVEADPTEVSVAHGLIVHAHVLVNTSRRLDWEDCQAIYRVFCKARNRAGISLYPDLKLSPLATKKDFLAWLHYVIKPLNFEQFYARGAAVCEDRAEHFNLAYDDIVFSGLNEVFLGIRSPRRYGNLFSHPRSKHYVGEKQYRRRISRRRFRFLNLVNEDVDSELTERERKEFENEVKRQAQKRKQVKEWEANKPRPRRGRPQSAKAHG